MKILLSGGGTLGPVVPLFAIASAVRQKYPEAEFVWVGTRSGPERELVVKQNIRFITIGVVKWRRYFSLGNIFGAIKFFFIFFQGIFIVAREKPALLISVGGFVSVPLHWAGALLGAKSWVHQQDVRIGLANRLMFPFARKVTTALEETAKKLSSQRAEWIGNPSRDLSATPEALARFRSVLGIPSDAPVIFALGGGTGSAIINQLVLDALSHWPAGWHVIHLVGKDRAREQADRASAAFPNYHVFDFFNDEMPLAYGLANAVVARAGFATLTELALLKKPSVIVPMGGTHQNDNARFFAEHGGIKMLDEDADTGLKLARVVKELIENPALAQPLGDRLSRLLPRATPEKIVGIVEWLALKR